MGSSQLTLPLDTATHGQAIGDMRRVVSKLVGHDRHVPGRFEKAIRPTKMALFTNLYLLIHGESAKIVLVKVVELCEYYYFTLRSIAKFSLVSKCKAPK